MAIMLFRDLGGLGTIPNWYSDLRPSESWGKSEKNVKNNLRRKNFNIFPNKEKQKDLILVY